MYSPVSFWGTLSEVEGDPTSNVGIGMTSSMANARRGPTRYMHVAIHSFWWWVYTAMFWQTWS